MKCDLPKDGGGDGVRDIRLISEKKIIQIRKHIKKEISTMGNRNVKECSYIIYL